MSQYINIFRVVPTVNRSQVSLTMSAVSKLLRTRQQWLTHDTLFHKSASTKGSLFQLTKT